MGVPHGCHTYFQPRLVSPTGPIYFFFFLFHSPTGAKYFFFFLFHCSLPTLLHHQIIPKKLIHPNHLKIFKSQTKYITNPKKISITSHRLDKIQDTSQIKKYITNKKNPLRTLPPPSPPHPPAAGSGVGEGSTTVAAAPSRRRIRRGGRGHLQPRRQPRRQLPAVVPFARRAASRSTGHRPPPAAPSVAGLLGSAAACHPLCAAGRRRPRPPGGGSSRRRRKLGGGGEEIEGGVRGGERGSGDGEIGLTSMRSRGGAYLLVVSGEFLTPVVTMNGTKELFLLFLKLFSVLARVSNQTNCQANWADMGLVLFIFIFFFFILLYHCEITNKISYLIYTNIFFICNGICIGCPIKV